MKIKDAIKDIILVLTHPDSWIRSAPTDKQWDKVFCELLETEKFIYRSTYTANLGQITVWIGSTGLFSAFQPWMPVEIDILPKRATAIRAMRKFNEYRVGYIHNLIKKQKEAQ